MKGHVQDVWSLQLYDAPVYGLHYAEKGSGEAGAARVIDCVLSRGKERERGEVEGSKKERERGEIEGGKEKERLKEARQRCERLTHPHPNTHTHIYIYILY